MFSRRRFLGYFGSSSLATTLFPGVLWSKVEAGEPITTATIAAAEKIAGLEFTEAEREMMVEDLTEQRENFATLRDLNLPNDVAPALVFDPTIGGVQPPSTPGPPMTWMPPEVELPANEDDLAFASVAELASLLRSRRITSRRLVELSLRRLKKYDPILHAVVTLTEDRALEKADQADRELDAGTWRGPLHGVPYGAKDLLAVRGYLTTWGATPYREQIIDADAAVVERLDAAGAVLVAKLTLGALAWGDVWFGGMTRNPWNVEQGSSGSSAGPASAVAAGLVPFAIGSETLGSIVSPSTRNGITGHRPTFGLVSRHGAMALSWSMDKLGPMARSAEDCALVFDAIRGKDPRDPATVEAPFPYVQDLDVRTLRIGYYASAFEADYDNKQADRKTLDVLRGLGIDLQPIELPRDLPVDAMLTTLSVEAAAAFDELTLSRGIDTMVRQTKNAWPHVFRTARFVPAVEFIQANRARTSLMKQMTARLKHIDVFVTPSYGGQVLSITNLTGHPCVCVPNAFGAVEGEASSVRRAPASVSFIGGHYKDAEVLSVARAYQDATDFHRKRPAVR